MARGTWTLFVESFTFDLALLSSAQSGIPDPLVNDMPDRKNHANARDACAAWRVHEIRHRRGNLISARFYPKNTVSFLNLRERER